MNDRKTFLAALGAAGALLATPRAEAQTAERGPSASPEAPAAEPPPAKKAKKGVAPAALAAAAAMRRFDPHLTDAEVASIAIAIDENARAAHEAFVSTKYPLHNSDEPVTVFAVRES